MSKQQTDVKTTNYQTKVTNEERGDYFADREKQVENQMQKYNETGSYIYKPYEQEQQHEQEQAETVKR